MSILTGRAGGLALSEDIGSDRMAAIHGLGRFSGAGLADYSAIDNVLAMPSVGQSVSGVGTEGHTWYYTTGLLGDIGATGGSDENLDAYIVLGGGGIGVTLVPEPGTWLLLLSALACGLLVRRRRGKE